MPSKPHSQTVRGQLGDPTSLKPETSNKSLPSNDSAPPRGQGNDADSNQSQKKQRAASVEPKEELPHSKKVRGTLANNDGKTVNKTQLGDPASLKAETSKTDLGRDVEREGVDKSGKSKL